MTTFVGMPTQEELAKYLGSGLAYPIEVVEGRPRVTSGTELLKMDILQLLMTSMGDGFFLPQRASRLHELTFEQSDEIFKSMAREFVVDAIERWEPRAKFQNIEFTFYSHLQEWGLKGREPSRVDILVHYLIKSEREVDSLIYPFYREAA